MRKISFSVLMVVHVSDDTRDLKKSIQSLTKQTLPPAEIVIVSDGALNRTHNEVLAVEISIPVRVFKYTGNDKLPGALNLGLSKVKHEIVARMDPDDISRCYRFEKQLDFFIKNELDVCGAWISEFDSDHKNSISVRKTPKNTRSPKVYLNNPINHMTAIFSKEMVCSVGGYEFVEGFEDWHLWLKIFKAGGKIRNLDCITVDAKIGNGFYQRRFGFSYLKMEANALRKFHTDGIMPFRYMILCVALRLVLRLSPKSARATIYSIARKVSG